MVETAPNFEGESGAEGTRAELKRLAQELEQTLPEHQANTRTADTQKILDFAAMVYGVAPYAESLDSGKYISWLQDLGNAGYDVAGQLNSPKMAIRTLTESPNFKAETQ